jgi:hypothetical protein
MQLDISHDPARLDRAMILQFLTTRAHWAAAWMPPCWNGRSGIR